MRMKLIYLSILMACLYNPQTIYAQMDCQCRLIYNYRDSTLNSKPSNAILYEYKNDSLLILKEGRSLIGQGISVENFNEYSNNQDTFIINKGDLYYYFLNNKLQFLNPKSFYKRKKTVIYHAGKSYLDTNKIAVSRTTYKPIGIEKNK